MQVSSSRGRSAGASWWLLLVAGILWIAFGLFVLQSHEQSARLVGFLVAVWLLYAAAAELVEAQVVPGWRWVHVALGILFVIAGIGAFLAPLQTFTVLASLMGLFLVVKGTFDFVVALAIRHQADLWWMTLVAGVLEMVLGIWAMGYPGRSAALLIAWIGIGAILRGVAEIIAAFRVRGAGEVAVA